MGEAGTGGGRGQLAGLVLWRPENLGLGDKESTDVGQLAGLVLWRPEGKRRRAVRRLR